MPIEAATVVEMDFADVFNALTKHMETENWKLKALVSFPDLEGFSKQDTDMTLLPIEYVRQSGCGDYGYRGDLYFPTNYSNGDGGVLHIHVEYYD